MRCDECGFDGDGLTEEDLASACDGFVRRFKAPLTRFLPNEDGPSVLRGRPSPSVWSALEYAAHTRDALAFYIERIERVLVEERPLLTKVGWETQAEERGWNDEDPASVAASLETTALALGARLRSLDGETWGRVGLSSEGDGAERTVRALAERAVHEGHHHLLDIGRSLRAARASA
jgi:hypothetical protein